jgi:hypothetical protein
MLDELKPFVEKFYKDYDVSKYTAYISDLVKAWYVMAISIAVAVVTAVQTARSLAAQQERRG